MSIAAFKKTYNQHKNKLYKFTIVFMYFNYWIFGIHPIIENRKFYSAFLLLWCLEIVWSTYLAIIYDVFGDEHSLNGFVSVVLYFSHTIGHLIILEESYRMNSNCETLFRQFNRIRQQLQVELMKPKNMNYNIKRFIIVMLIIIKLLVTCHSIIMWTTFETPSVAGQLYWRSLQSDLALQIKSLEFLTVVVQLNSFSKVLRRALNNLGEQNLRRVFKRGNPNLNTKVILVASLNEEKEDEDCFKKLKNCYHEIYVAFQLYNKIYGLSLLISLKIYFVDLVCNTYWIVLAIITQGRDYYGLLQNISFAFLAFSLLTILCWFSDECYYESRYIGCLVSKLVKPLGNKRYNDLVSEFSIQTLHQRFVITAKEFFSLNLNLLGSMVAAIVTYLIILIQFMFTEKNNKESKLYTKGSLITSTMATNLKLAAYSETSAIASILNGFMENNITNANNNQIN